MTRRTVIILVCALAFFASGPLLSYLLVRHTACDSSNAFRKLDQARWDYVIDLTKDVPRTAHDQQVRDQFVSYVHAADAQKNCWP